MPMEDDGSYFMIYKSLIISALNINLKVF